jgi:hypothetical protein
LLPIRGSDGERFVPVYTDNPEALCPSENPEKGLDVKM